MKNYLLTIALIVLGVGVCYSQNKKVKDDSITKYVGVYYFVVPSNDSTVKYDYMTFTEKNGKLYCTRDFMFSFKLAGNVSKQSPNHQVYEVVSINTKENTITLKYMDSQCSYRFRTNAKGNLELVVIENALIYERR